MKKSLSEEDSMDDKVGGDIGVVVVFVTGVGAGG